MASDFDIKKDTKGEYYWVLNAANGQVLCKSTDGYTSMQSCKDSIKIVKDLASKAPVWDVTQDKPSKIEI
jgi:uncharacterized protein